MDFPKIITEERDRLTQVIKELEQKKREIDAEILAAQKELYAIDAYEAARSGKDIRRVRIGSRRSGMRNELTNLIKGHPDGLTRADILLRMNLKGDKSGERSVSNALSALKKQGMLDSKDGNYTLVAA